MHTGVMVESDPEETVGHGMPSDEEEKYSMFENQRVCWMDKTSRSQLVWYWTGLSPNN